MSREWLFDSGLSGDTAAEAYDEREGVGETLLQASYGLVPQVVEFVRDDNEALHFCQRAQGNPDMARKKAGRLKSETFNDVRLD